MFLDGFGDETKRINEIIKKGAFNESSFFEREIRDFLISRKRRDMLCAERYYLGRQDILKRKRTVIGEGGEITEVHNLPNHRIVDNQYARLIDQKVNYLLGKPITYRSDNKVLLEMTKSILNSGFERILKRIGEDCLNGGIGWLYVFLDEKGRLSFTRFKPEQIIPFWADCEHTRLEGALRLYSRSFISQGRTKKIKYVEFYSPTGITKFVFENGRLYKKENQKGYFFSKDGGKYDWGRTPIIAFRQNRDEISILRRVKALQDGLNEMRSDFLNNMQEDKRNTILVIKNYDGTDLGEFRRNLSQYGAVKVRTVDGAEGGIDTLNVEVSSDSYQAVCDMLKKAIVENGRGLDTRDERFNSNPNQMNILSIYQDIDLDADAMEGEFRAGFEDIFFFIKKYLLLNGFDVFDNEKIDAIFNRDQMLNESEIIDSCVKSMGILSEKSVIEQHPWVDDVYEELERLKNRQESNTDQSKKEEENGVV